MCKICSVEGCDKQVIAKGYCSKHYNQIRKYGKILENTSADPNIIKKVGDYAEMYLYNAKHELVGKALIDLDDIERIKQYRWSTNKNREKNLYVQCTKLRTGLHRFIMNVTDSKTIVDHINRNPLDNRKCNLRICTNQQNICNCDIPKNNKSGCKGVYWAKDKQKWTVQISINNKTKYIGRYSSYEEAVKARIEAAKKYYGEFANDESLS